ncbi:MAG: FAD-dependent oxidoreductase, partial [Cyclobacteriaceae bacterium]
MRDIVIIGGGLAGLVNAVMLSRAGLDVLLIEK